MPIQFVPLFFFKLIRQFQPQITMNMIQRDHSVVHTVFESIRFNHIHIEIKDKTSYVCIHFFFEDTRLDCFHFNIILVNFLMKTCDGCLLS